MGVSVFPVFNPRAPRASFTAEGKLLAAQFHILDQLCVHLGVPTFSSFGDNRELPDDWEGDPADYFDELPELDEWYDPAAGIAVCEALAGAIRRSRGSGDLQDPELVAEELDSLASALRAAQKAGARFHLEMA